MKTLTNTIKYEFITTIPQAYKGKVELISGDNSKQFPSPEYLIISYQDHSQQIYEIRTEYFGFAKRDIILTDTLLAVGIYDHFYIYNTASKLNLNSFNVAYFQAVFFYNNCFYVSGLDQIFCFDTAGNLKWASDCVAHDGVLISEITDTTISGQGGWDPPDGLCTNFSIDIQTGKLLTYIEPLHSKEL